MSWSLRITAEGAPGDIACTTCEKRHVCISREELQHNVQIMSMFNETAAHPEAVGWGQLEAVCHGYIRDINAPLETPTLSLEHA